LASLLLLGVEYMSSLVASATQPLPKENLRQAFELFNEMSQQLSSSYENLESQVQLLTGELAEVSAARIKELKEKERLADRLHSLLQLLPGGVVVLDGNGRVQECNLAAKTFLGAIASPADNSMGAGLSLDKEKVDIYGQLWRNIIKENFCPKEDDGHEVSLKNGKRLSIQTSSLESEPGQIILMTDQTQTRMLQDKLARHERLMAMGNMVASLAHQVRTPLSGATLYAQHLASDNLDSETRDNFSKKLGRQLKNIEAQVRDMLIFARGSAPLNQLINIPQLLELLEDSKSILENQFQSDIEIILDESAVSNNKIIEIQCHQESLIGAIQNLMTNGIEAAEEITQSVKLTVRLGIERQSLNISVSDNGPGIKSHEKNKLTDGFFSTKSNGTGLGLSVVKAVIRAHHGQLGFYNQAQGGAIFVISLPLKQHQENAL
jgi:two-component system sensor histidine kinase FlrB